jgi:dienelactone hydrolase
MKRSTCLLLLLFTPTARAADADPTRLFGPDHKPADSRIGKVRTHDDKAPTFGEKDFFFTVPPIREAWEARRTALRQQVLVSQGLWPLPERTPLNAVVHGKIDRDGYTIEKVFFASYPGHYVSGNLYRPKGKSGKVPGVLFAHGHWKDGRLHDAGEKTAQEQIKQGAEKDPDVARLFMQAIPVQLARMGCVVFHYDMVGVADSQAIPHAKGFADADGELRLQSAMGLQTWNSMRALDFLLSLPDVDGKRVGMTGASGGGTQTFILAALDDRLSVAFPAVMVSTSMQGGCVCENCSYLRQGTGNVELAGMFAPKPLGMTGAKDWTVDIETKGLPELKKLYKLYDAEDRVMAKCLPQFGHNYNQVSREVMYNWFNKHLALGQPEPVVEKPFTPTQPKELSVYTADHPRPADSVGAERLRQYLSEASDKQIEALRPKDAKGLDEYRRVFGTALRVMIDDRLPKADDVEAKMVGERETRDGVTWRRMLLGRKGSGEQVPTVGLGGPEFDGTVVVWVHPEGKASLWKDGKLTSAAQKILDGKAAILAVDVYGTGELPVPLPPAVNASYAGYTFGYNRPLLAQRVHDVLTAVAYAKGHEKTKAVHLVGFEKAGPWVLLARGLCGDAVKRTAADFDGFRFEKVRSTTDEMMLPGGLKYGGLPALAALAVPGELYDHNHQGTGSGHWVKAVYDAAGAADKLHRHSEKQSADKVAEWLVR